MNKIFNRIQFIFFAVGLTSAQISQAAIEPITVADWWTPERVSEPHRLLIADGRILKVSASQTELVAALFQHWDRGHRSFLAEVNGSEVTALVVSELVTEEADHGFRPLYDLPPFDSTNYQPTVMTESSAVGLFSGLETRMKKDSQCYQRAHYWSYQMWSGHSVKSMKAFVFFTRRYINEYEYEWWFHVAPAVQVSKPEPEPYVMDRSFFRGPTPLNAWSKSFIKSGWSCPIIQKYSDYSENQYSQYCYVRVVPMFYYQPANVASLDASNKTVTGWVPWELKNMKKALRFGARRDSDNE